MGSKQSERDRRLKELKAQVAPLKAKRLKLQAEINRVTFESVIDGGADPKGLSATDLKGLGEPLGLLESQIAPLMIEEMSVSDVPLALQEKFAGIVRQFGAMLEGEFR